MTTIKEIDFLKQLKDQIAERVKKKREVTSCFYIEGKWQTWWALEEKKELVNKDTKKRRCYQKDVCDDRSQYSAIEQGKIKKRKNEKQGEEPRDRNFMSRYVAEDISKNLGINIHELVYGDEDTIRSNVKWIFYEVASNMDTRLYTFNNDEFKAKYPNITRTSEKLRSFLMFDAELSKMNGNSNFMKSKLDLDQLQGFNTEKEIREERKKLEKELNRTIGEKRQEYIKIQLNYLDSQENTIINKKDLFTSKYLRYNDLNKQFEERLSELVDWVWRNEGKSFIKSFVDKFVMATNKEGEFYFNLLNINRNIEEWINTELFEVIEELQVYYSNDEVYHLGYEIAEILELRNDIWLSMILNIGKSNMIPKTRAKFKSQIMTDYEDFIDKLVDRQRESLSLNSNSRSFFSLEEGLKLQSENTKNINFGEEK